MRTFIKKILFILPRPVRTLIVLIREAWWRFMMRRWERVHYPNLPDLKKRNAIIRNILIYQIGGLSHGGTEKNLQLIANALAKKYKVFFMYGDKKAEASRIAVLNPEITLIPFSYDEDEVAVPHRITNMRPHIKEVLTTQDIDLVITASPGYAHYPWNIVTNIPIVLSNIFGAPTLQKNIVATVFMSNTVRLHAEAWTGPRPSHHTMYLPLGKSSPTNARSLGSNLRTQCGILTDDFVFGRIGRDDDGIFDPIGIKAWKKIANRYPNAHYLIMSPPPALVKIIENEKIPRVYLLPPSGKEEDIWSFHGAIDCFAHFRYDGETSGVAIAESLTIGNPIISHRSPIWNAHLEYLTEDCARIAEINDVEMYANYMSEYIELKTNDRKAWEARCEAARHLGEKKFSPIRYASEFQKIIEHINPQ